MTARPDPGSEDWYVQLCRQLTAAVTAADRVAGDGMAWVGFDRAAQAGRELGEAQQRWPDSTPDSGQRMWYHGVGVGQIALSVMVEEAKAVETLLASRTTYAVDVLTRSILEAGSLAWWLLDPDICMARRAARYLLYDLNGANEANRAVDTLNLSRDQDRSEYWQSTQQVQDKITRLGWSVGGKRDETITLDNGDREQRVRYSSRVADLTKAIWSAQPKLPYALLSAVAHSEELGLMHHVSMTDDGTVVLSADGSAAWLWQDAYLITGALLMVATRAARFLGLSETNRLDALTSGLQKQLEQLRPVGPDDM